MSHDTNPFGVEKIKERQVVRKGREIEVADTESGALMTLKSSDGTTTRQHDYGSYVKLFKEGVYKTLLKTSTPARAILCYILVILKPGQDIVELHHVRCKKQFKELSGGSYYRGLKELLELELLAESTTKHHYWINLNYFFNGDRRRPKR